MRLHRLAALGFAALLAAGCGEILAEIDHANDLAGKPSGNRPPPAAGRPPEKGPAPTAATARTGRADGASETEQSLVSRLEGWLGLGSGAKDDRRPPDPNDPMVLCRLDGSTGFMLKSGCVNRRGTVVANKGVPH